MKQVFKNLKVVEIASVLAGPSVGMFFSELGAQVIKVENKKTNGDVTRSWKLPSESKKSNVSAYFCSVNYKKTHLFYDLSNPKDIAKVKVLIHQADIVILNFKKRDDIKFGLDYNSLEQENPKLIYATINGFGEESDRVAFDLILQAETGFMSMNGTSTSGPVKMPVALIDVLAGHQLKEGILVALYERQKSGKGKKVSVSLYDTAIASLANQATNWLMANHVAKPIGSKHPNIAPYGELFKTKDHKLITFAIGSNKQFSNLCKVLNLEKLLKDDRFVDNASRVKNRVELQQILKNEIQNYSSKTLLPQLHHLFVPVAKINSIDEVFKNKDAQKLILTENIDGIETKRVKTVVFK
jgi:crotonobetainyl-CoA:carnitine CoA-transferase CaiB-like acyl-CoA transferase